jgi:hypothetical protein
LNLNNDFKNLEFQYSKNKKKFNQSLDFYIPFIQNSLTNENISEILKTDKKYLRAFYFSCFNLHQISQCVSFLKEDQNAPIFSHHMYFLRVSSEIFNLENSPKLLSNHLNSILPYLNQYAKNNQIGTTIGYAIGFLIGQSLFRGVDVLHFYENIDSSVIENHRQFIDGLISGFKNKTSLCFDKDYIKNLNNRYDNWENKSKIISFSLFKKINQQKLDKPIITDNNYELLKIIQNFDSAFSQFLKENPLEISPKNLEFDPFSRISELERKIQYYEQIFQEIDSIIPHFSENILNSPELDIFVEKLHKKIKNQEPLDTFFQEKPNHINSDETKNSFTHKIKSLL